MQPQGPRASRLACVKSRCLLLRFTFADLLLGMVITVAQHQRVLLILSRITFHSSGFRGGEGRAEDVF